MILVVTCHDSRRDSSWLVMTLVMTHRDSLWLFVTHDYQRDLSWLNVTHLNFHRDIVPHHDIHRDSPWLSSGLIMTLLVPHHDSSRASSWLSSWIMVTLRDLSCLTLSHTVTTKPGETKVGQFVAIQMMGNSYNDACKQVKNLLIEADLDCNGSVIFVTFFCEFNTNFRSLAKAQTPDEDLSI